MATVGIDPTNFGILNDHPTKIPPGELLGGVVKNCLNVSETVNFFSSDNFPVLVGANNNNIARIENAVQCHS